MNKKFQSFTKFVRFEALVQSIQNCNLCPRMQCRRKVFSEANGNLNSKVLFIAEAPGRLGADHTGIPLHGDKTGDNFETLLQSVNWDRKDNLGREVSSGIYFYRLKVRFGQAGDFTSTKKLILLR